MAAGLTVEPSPIPGLLVIRLPVHGDNRGWFKENWQRAKMTALGVPDFGPVQNNVAYNDRAGATRGLHAEPWEKLVSVAHGRILGAWVDLREGQTFGTSFSLEMGPEMAVFVPRGVANGYQTLVDDTAYSYLVNDHWSPEAREKYTYVNLADERAGIPWPIPLDRAELSEADRHHPTLDQVAPMQGRRTLILGAGGQLGRAVGARLPSAEGVTREELDIADPKSLAAWDWSSHDVVINAAAYTAVDTAETEQGRRDAWAANAAAPARLAQLSREHGFRLVHVSTDYVFDGRAASYAETDPVSPLGVYGQSKASGDLAVTTAPGHLVLRTSWLIGAGGNFVRTMVRLADQGVSPTVVEDQTGRLTFTSTLVDALTHLLDCENAVGVYNVTNSGPTTSWCDVAREVFRLRGRDPDDVIPVSTAEYAAGRSLAPRPASSTLDLGKLTATGYTPPDAFAMLARYLAD